MSCIISIGQGTVHLLLPGIVPTRFDLYGSFTQEVTRIHQESRLAQAEESALLTLGQQLFSLLDGPHKDFSIYLERHGGPLLLEVHTTRMRKHRAEELAVFNGPWEILANGRGFLARDTALRLAVKRSMGKG